MRIRTSVTNRMCNEANSIRCSMCVIKKKGTGYFLFFEIDKCVRIREVEKEEEVEEDVEAKKKK